MSQLMKCRAVIPSSVLEGVLRWQVDAVLRAAIECAIRLVVRDVRARVRQDLLSRLDSLEGCVLLGRVRRNPLDLLGVEDRVYAVNEPRFLGIRVVAIGCIAASIRPRRPCLVRRLFDIPVLNLGALLAPAYLPSVVCGLLVSHPSRVFVAVLQAGGHQMNRVAAPVSSLAGWIERHTERTGSRLPGLLPRRDATLQHSNNAVGDLLAKVPKSRFLRKRMFDGKRGCSRHGRYSSPSDSEAEKLGSGSSLSKPDPANGSPPTPSISTAG